MRKPVRSEPTAFWFTIVFAALTLGSLALGALTEPLAGVVLYASFAGESPSIPESDVIDVLLGIWVKAIYGAPH